MMVENDIILGLVEAHSPGLKLAVTLHHLAEGGHSTCE